MIKTKILQWFTKLLICRCELNPKTATCYILLADGGVFHDVDHLVDHVRVIGHVHHITNIPEYLLKG